VANVTSKNLREVIVKTASGKSYMMTDESAVYPSIGAEFAGHGSVNHSAGEYVKTGGFHHTNTVESHFALLKRGVYGTFHNVSEAHLHRYLAEFDFRANTRDLTDAERAALLLASAQGKRLLYRQPDKAQNCEAAPARVPALAREAGEGQRWLSSRLMRAQLAATWFSLGLQTARELLGKSYPSLSPAEKAAVDQLVLAQVGANFQAITPEWLAAHQARPPIGFQAPTETYKQRRHSSLHLGASGLSRASALRATPSSLLPLRAPHGLGQLGARLGGRLQQPQQHRVKPLLDGLVIVASLVAHAGEHSMFSATFGNDVPEPEPSLTTRAEIGRLCAAWAYLEALTEATLWGILDADEKLGPIITARLELRGRWDMILRHAPNKHQTDVIEILKDINKDLTPTMRDRNIIIHGLVHAVVEIPYSIPPVPGTAIPCTAIMQFDRVPCWTVFRGGEAGKNFPISTAAVEVVRANIQELIAKVQQFNDQHSYDKFTRLTDDIESEWPVPLQ
jgi:hypothetical protein